MIKNFIAGGCSFTSDTQNTKKTWATVVGQEFSFYKNLASGGAGNYYISSSVIDYLESTNLDPNETLVAVMWSGVGRKDLLISGEYYFWLKKDYPFLASTTEQETYYLFSGGVAASWLDNSETREAFKGSYKFSDPQSLCNESLFEIIKLKGYLESKRYNYVFTNYFDCWMPDKESGHGGDYSIGFFCKDTPMYQNLDRTHYWVNNFLGNYAEERSQLDNTWHPTDECHTSWANEVMLPYINQFY